MPVTEMILGAPCWFELASTDPAKSFAFYRDLFEWVKLDMDLGEIGTYSFLNNKNGGIGALCSMQDQQKAAGVPSHWLVYFAVEDCDSSTAQAESLGGTVLLQPMDVSGHGRMSIVSDPSGAVCCLWQTVSSGDGQFIMFEDHAVGWVELATRDSNAAKLFYGNLLNWSFSESKIPIPTSEPYLEIEVSGTRYGGILPMNEQWGDMAPHWSIYIMVPDIDVCVARTSELGGNVCVPPFDAPGVGRIAMIQDPTGAGTYIIQLNKN